MKKLKIYWIAAYAANALALLLFFKQINITFCSIMPVAMVLSYALYSVKWNYRRTFSHMSYSKDVGWAHKGRRFRGDEDENFDLYFMISITPLFMPFVFFFGDGGKMLGSIGVLMLIAAVYTIYILRKAKKENEQRKMQEEAELKEQRKREEQGRM